jgi:uncharacterized protein with von Willebrand factor type A (vWA) domain
MEGSKSVVVHDPFDAEAFEEILPRAVGLQLLLNESRAPHAKELAFDLFCSFYKYFVKLLPPGQIAPGFGPHRDLLARALDLREHHKLRTLTRLRGPEAALATELVLEPLLEELRPFNMGGSEESPAAGAQGDDGEGPAANPEVTTERIREVLREAREDLQGAVELITTWSVGPGQEMHLPSELKLRLMRELLHNPRLGRIALLFGRYRRLGLQERQLRALVTSEEVVDYVQGGDAARALAGELANFALEEREDLFYAKVVARSLLIYELWRRENEPHPVYICLDNSGSMAGEKEAWAKAMSLALAHLALAHGHSVEVIQFGDAADPLHVTSFRPEDDAPSRLAKVMDIASYFLGGGTDFVKPLSLVLDAMEGRDRARSEVLFVSDGMCPLPEAFVQQFLQAKARYDLRLTTVVIGGEPASLSEISDNVHRLEDVLEAGEALAAHFASSLLERIPGSASLGRTQGKGGGRGTPLLFDHFLPDHDKA